MTNIKKVVKPTGFPRRFCSLPSLGFFPPLLDGDLSSEVTCPWMPLQESGRRSSLAPFCFTACL